LGGLPDGDERDAWEARIVAHAQGLRLFQEVMPLMNKVYPWIPVFLFVGATTLAIFDPRQIDAMFAEGPIMIPLSPIALPTFGIFGVTGVLGLTPEGKSAEGIARQRGLLQTPAKPEA
jgi:hypothetical protein